MWANTALSTLRGAGSAGRMNVVLNIYILHGLTYVEDVGQNARKAALLKDSASVRASLDE